MIWSTQWRNGVQIEGYFNRIEFWDFNFQQTTQLTKTIMPGDRINTHCIFQQNAIKPTVFSLASSDEMCVEYVFYYPRLNGPFCSFYYVQQFSSNLTLCLNSPQFQPNPSVVDPVGGELKTFGGTNPIGFQCGGTAVSNSPIPTTPRKSDTTQFAVNFVVCVLLLALVF